MAADPDKFLPGASRDRERREALRIDILGTLRADVLMPQRVAITDISATGLQVASTFPFHLDAVYEFRLTLDHDVVIVKGRVVHAAVKEVDREGVEYRTGFDLVDVPEAGRLALEQFAARLLTARSGTTSD